MAEDDRGFLLDLAGVRFVIDGNDADEEQPERAYMKFVGAGVVVADDPAAIGGKGATVLTISDAGSGGAPTGAAGGDLFGTYPDPFVKGYHPSAGGTQVLIGTHAVGTLLERTGTNTAAGSAYWLYGTTAPQGAVSATEGAFYLKTDSHELYQNTSSASGTSWERVWPVQIIDDTTGGDIAMPARSKIRIEGNATVTDNSGEGSTDIKITPSGSDDLSWTVADIPVTDVNSYTNSFECEFDLATLWPQMPDNCGIFYRVSWIAIKEDGDVSDLDANHFFGAYAYGYAAYNDRVKIQQTDNQAAGAGGYDNVEGWMTSNNSPVQSEWGVFMVPPAGGNIGSALATATDSEVDLASCTLEILTVQTRNEYVP